MHPVAREFALWRVTDRATLTQRRGIGQSVRSCRPTDMATRTRRGHWANGRDQAARVADLLQAGLQRQLLGAVHVAGGAIAPVAGEAHLTEVVLRAAETVNDQRPAIRLQLLASVNLVNHLRKIDRLRRSLPGRPEPRVVLI